MIHKNLNRFLHEENTSGIILFTCLILALFWINAPFGHSYHGFWATELPVDFNGLHVSFSLHHLINDGLMTIFFFVVGMELKREFLVGELASRKRAILPVFAALGGMIFPALIFTFFNAEKESISGWGIPMATDIAFAVGLLVFLKNKVSAGLKVFLTALAIADDFGAVVVIAVFYTSNLALEALLIAFSGLALLAFLNKRGVTSIAVYVLIGTFLVWIPIMLSGVHSTIAGVLVAFTIPSGLSKNGGETGSSPLKKLETTLHPWVAFLIMPLFAISNAGIEIHADMLDSLMNSVTVGVFSGLVLGKLLGIFLFSWLIIKTGLASLPLKTSWIQLFSASFLGGIGFTMSLFVTSLAFSKEEYILQAKTGILAASFVAAMLGMIFFKIFVPEPEPSPDL